MVSCVIFTHETWNSEMRVQVVDPSLADCHHFINDMKISYSQVAALEAATHAQSES